MSSTVGNAREELRSLLASGVDLQFRPHGPGSTRTPRKSAVLILFGALDRVLADSQAGSVPAELDVLLMRRSSTLRHHAGQVSFPGGGVEPADTGPIDTALREAHEETGLDPAGVEILGTMPEVHIAVSDYLVTPVVGWWAKPSTVAADHSESVEVFRVPVAELLDPASRGTSVIRRGGLAYRGDAFQLQRQGHIVWGFTGVLLSHLFEKLGWASPWDASREFEIIP